MLNNYTHTYTSYSQLFLHTLLCYIFISKSCADCVVAQRGQAKPSGAEKRLYRYLMLDYEMGSRPVIEPNKTVVIHVGVKLNQILDLVRNLSHSLRSCSIAMNIYCYQIKDLLVLFLNLLAVQLQNKY